MLANVSLRWMVVGPPPPPARVPGLPDLGAAIVALALAGAGFLGLRRRAAAPRGT